MNKTTNKRMKDLEDTLEEIERKILIEKSKISVKVSEEQIRKFYNQALKEEPQILINYLIKKIKLYNDAAEITFNNPIMKSPNNMGFSFLYTNGIFNKYVQNKPQPKKIEMQITFKI